MAQTDWRQLHGDAFAGVRVLITGGAGFIGSHLVEALAMLGAQCVVLDNLAGGERGNIAAFPHQFIEGDILDEALLAQATVNCRYLFHLAALGSVPHSIEEPMAYHRVNATGTVLVLEQARAAGVQRVIYSASSSAYGDAPQLPKRESMPVNPRSPYASAKLAGEGYVSAYTACYGLDAVSLRYFNIFGPRQNANSAYAAVIAAFAKAILSGRRPTIFGDGEQSRDFTYVHNAVHANLLAARCPRPLGGEVVNVATGQRIELNRLAPLMCQMFGRPDLQPEHAPPRVGDVKHSQADLSRAREVLGYEPIVDFREGLRATVDWYRQTLG